MTTRILPAAPLLFLSALAAADPAERVTAPATADGLEVVAGATGTTAVSVSSGGGFGSVAYYRGNLRLAATLAAQRGGGYLGGSVVDDQTTAGGQLGARWRLVERGGVAFELGGALGASSRSAEGAAMPSHPGRATIAGGELEARAVIGTGPVRGVLGLAMPVWWAAAGPDELAQVTRAGVEIEVRRDLWVIAQAEAGGSYGYDGDGPKLRAGAQLGMKWAPSARGRIGERGARGPVGVFLQTEWRGFALADHLSHGPGLAAGVTLLGGHLKLGILAHGRPGAVNPATFDTMTVGGQSYKGRSTIPLRSDGNFLGLVAAPAFAAGPLRIELPIAFGQAAYGFYLAGDDRDTPDGRRVSAWENELFDGRDSSFAIGGEVGVAVALPLRGWLEPYLAARYSWTIGYDTLVRDSYNGPSLALGVQVRP